MWDIVRFARREGILCQGRGSAANSAVCYCLGITAVDPIRLDLLFERFLSEERTEAPDIDIDFAHRERERVLQYVYERYGRDHAAMVCEQITYRGKSAVRDAARVLGFSVEQADSLALLSDRFSAKATAEALRATPASDAASDGAVASALGGGDGARHRGDDTGARREGEGEAGEATDDVGRPADAATRRTSRTGARTHRARARATSRACRSALHESPPREAIAGKIPTPATITPSAATRPPRSRDTSGASIVERAGLDPADKRVRALADVVGGLHQLPRHRSIHVGGFVLTAEPLHQSCPSSRRSMPGRTVIQWEKDDLDPVGLVKIDLLGLGMLTLLQDCLLYIRQHARRRRSTSATLDMTDQAVYDDLCAADTIGIFQVESRAQMNTLPRLKPRCFYDLVVEVALIRPGPIQGEMVHPYLRRRERRGAGDVSASLARADPQAHARRAALPGAGDAGGDRRGGIHARRGRRAAPRDGAQAQPRADGGDLPEADRRDGDERHRAEETARRIYNQINAFADYGFPESHAASFALLVYASAYLKHYYAPEFTAAILNAQPMGFYAPGTLVEDARRHGVEVRPVDVTRSGWDATLERRDDPRCRCCVEPVGHALAETRARGDAWHAERSRRVESASARARQRCGSACAACAGSARRRATASRRRSRERPFTSIEDVVRRSGLDQRGLRHLAEAGAFDALLPHEPDVRQRRAALWALLDAARGDAGPLAPRRRTASGDARLAGAASLDDARRAHGGRLSHDGDLARRPSDVAPARRCSSRTACAARWTCCATAATASAWPRRGS